MELLRRREPWRICFSISLRSRSRSFCRCCSSTIATGCYAVAWSCVKCGRGRGEFSFRTVVANLRTFVHGLSTTLQHREHRDLILELRHIVVCGSAKWHGKDVVVRAFEAYDWTANRFSVHFLLFMMDFRAILPLAFDRKNLRPGTGIDIRQTRVGIIIEIMLTCYSTRKQCDTQLNTHKERSRPRAPGEKNK